MAIRSGMTELVSQFRSYVHENGQGIFSDERIQQILDSNSTYLYQAPLAVIPQRSNGSLIYQQYVTDRTWLEGTATSTNKIYDANGSVVTNYTSDFINGKFTFSSDTRGTPYYLDGRSYNFFKAVSEGWYSKAAHYSTQFDFTVEGRSYKKSQIIQQCTDLAKQFAARGQATLHSIDRGDMFGGIGDDYSG